MKILAVECSATPCSVAVSDGEIILAFSYSNVKLTHSQTLLPMVEQVLSASLTELSEIDAFAVSSGPGSFTGIRIGISLIKGMAAPFSKPCASVSSLRAMAENYSDTDCYVCAVMDARCQQVYNAIFDNDNGLISRICEDRAISCAELSEEISKLSESADKPIYIVGDGAEMFYSYLKDDCNIFLSDEKRRFQNAQGVISGAKEILDSGNGVSPEGLLPVYLRLPQAERELNLKRSKKL